MALLNKHICNIGDISKLNYQCYECSYEYPNTILVDINQDKIFKQVFFLDLSLVEEIIGTTCFTLKFSRNITNGTLYVTNAKDIKLVDITLKGERDQMVLIVTPTIDNPLDGTLRNHTNCTLHWNNIGKCKWDLQGKWQEV